MPHHALIVASGAGSYTHTHAHTHTHTNTHTHTHKGTYRHSRTEVILRNQVYSQHACFKNVKGYIIR